MAGTVTPPPPESRPGSVQSSTEATAQADPPEAVLVKTGAPFFPSNQPYLGIFEVQFGTESDAQVYTVNARPNNNCFFSFERSVNQIGMFTIRLADPTWTGIERAVNRARGVVRFRYGYSDADSDKTITPWISGIVFKYSVKFFANFSLITLRGIALGFELNRFQSHDYKGLAGKSISEMMEKIAEDNGFDHVVEPTKKIGTRDGIDTTDEVNKIFVKAGETPLQFILNKLAPLAINEAGIGEYVFFVSINKEDPTKPILHFHTPGYKKPGESEDKIYTFTLYGTPMTPVIYFEPNWSMAQKQIFGGTKTWTAGLDPDTKEVKKIVTTIENNPQNPTGGNQYTTLEKPTEENAACDIFHAAGIGAGEEFEASVKSHYSRKWKEGIGGSLSLMGITQFNVLDNIQVIVYIPTGPDSTSQDSATPAGSPHWTSGSFLISSIVDQIDMGNFSSTWELFSTGRNVQIPYETIR